MSNREFAKNLIDQIPENNLFYVIPYLQWVSIQNEIPNAETLEAMAETDEMIRTGSGQHFKGKAADFFSMLEKED